MKNFYALLFVLFITTISFAQGMSVQGIARDNANSAIATTNLTFTFSITKNDNTALYVETQIIKTDNFGVFSHIVGTGNTKGSLFNEIDFSIKELKLKVSINYNGADIEVYNQALQYTPYAHYAKRAENGVPTGAIMPFTGKVAPLGWVFCDGQDLNRVEGTTALKLIVGDLAPDLRGMFLRGTGTNSVNSQNGPALLATQLDAIKSHDSSGETNEDGIHMHTIGDYYPNNTTGNPNGATDTDSKTTNDARRYWRGTQESITRSTGSSEGKHSHKVTTSYTGLKETRPVNYGVNYIIKL